MNINWAGIQSQMYADETFTSQTPSHEKKHAQNLTLILFL